MNIKMRVIIALSIVLSMLACGIGGSQRALELARAISPYPDAVFLGEYRTTYPDGNPGVGLIYESNSEVQLIVDYYKEELDRQGWKVEEVRNLDDAAVPAVIVSSRGWSTCFVTIEDLMSSRKITIKVE